MAGSRSIRAACRSGSPRRSCSGRRASRCWSGPTTWPRGIRSCRRRPGRSGSSGWQRERRDAAHPPAADRQRDHAGRRVRAHVAQLIFGNEFQTVMFLPGSWHVGGLDFAKSRTLAFSMAAVISLLLWAFLRFSFTGRAIHAVSQSPEGASVCGIDIGRTRILSFALGSALAAAAGVLLVMIFAISPAMGTGYTVRSFAVTVIGGLGSFPGALLGALVLGMAEVFTGYLASAQVANGIAFLLFLAVLLTRPQGLFGRKIS